MIEIKLQAPKGGCYSKENGEWYEGGQFLPNTPMSKSNRSKINKIVKNPINIAHIIVKKGYSNTFNVQIRFANDLNYKILHVSENINECNDFAKILKDLKSKWYINNGFEPHQIIIDTF